jgi:hypothetical protein
MAHSSRRSGRCFRVARARWRALLTAATLASRSDALSPADQPSTSRRISTARCFGGRCWMAARNASSIVSLATTAASGSAALAATSSGSRSGYGCSHGISGGGTSARLESVAGVT